MTAGHGADLERVDTRNLARHDDRNTQCAESDRGRVGNQAQPCGIDRVEAQAHQQRCSNRHWRTETCCTLKECAKAEGDQQHLQARVVGDGQDRAADNLELTAFNRQFVEEYRCDDDPGNRPDAIGKPVSGGCNGHISRHFEGEDRDQYR